MTLKQIDISAAVITEREDGIIHVHFKQNSTLDTALQLEMRRIYSELTGGQRTGFIFSAEEGFQLTKEARENFRNLKENSPIRAYAIVISSLPQRLIANFFLKVYKPSVPFRLFKSPEEAATWLQSPGSME